MPTFKSKIIPILIAASASLPAAGTLAQTKVDVPISARAERADVEAPPACSFPCEQEFVLPPFARRLSLAGENGTFETRLSRRAFLIGLEDWRRHLELYRRTIEHKLDLAAEDEWDSANVAYQVELGLYDQFFESYRNAIRMDRGGRITYGNETL